MSKEQDTPSLVVEIADLLVSLPTREQLLRYRPSKPLQRRASELLAKNRDGTLTRDEQWELDQFTHMEMLMRLVKAGLRTKKGKRPHSR